MEKFINSCLKNVLKIYMKNRETSEAPETPSAIIKDRSPVIFQPYNVIFFR